MKSPFAPQVASLPDMIGQSGQKILLLKRVALEDKYTIGRLYVDGRYFCDILEDKVRDLNENGHFDNGETKIKGQTAIPYGQYEIDMRTVSPKFRTRSWASKYSGIVPRLLDVPSFDGVLIHPGNTAADTEGCLLPGDNSSVGRVSQSQYYYFKLMDQHLIPARDAGKKIYIKIV